jgi:hypothetical protein
MPGRDYFSPFAASMLSAASVMLAEAAEAPHTVLEP